MRIMGSILASCLTPMLDEECRHAFTSDKEMPPLRMYLFSLDIHASTVFKASLSLDEALNLYGKCGIISGV
ncbi:MAG: hypothetical protein M0024_05530 [Nitrospiraceae bacterium]|nr:hypothetical protein [Nitrospiraceae bacterium]